MANRPWDPVLSLSARGRVNHVIMADFAFDNVVHLSPF